VKQDPDAEIISKCWQNAPAQRLLCTL